MQKGTAVYGSGKRTGTASSSMSGGKGGRNGNNRDKNNKNNNNNNNNKYSFGKEEFNKGCEWYSPCVSDSNKFAIESGKVNDGAIKTLEDRISNIKYVYGWYLTLFEAVNMDLISALLHDVEKIRCVPKETTRSLEVILVMMREIKARAIPEMLVKNKEYTDLYDTALLNYQRQSAVFSFYNETTGNNQPVDEKDVNLMQQLLNEGKLQYNNMILTNRLEPAMREALSDAASKYLDPRPQTRVYYKPAPVDTFFIQVAHESGTQLYRVKDSGVQAEMGTDVSGGSIELIVNELANTSIMPTGFVTTGGGRKKASASVSKAKRRARTDTHRHE